MKGGTAGGRPVVVVVGQFPEFSQTFVVDHVRGLSCHGWMVHVVARKVDYPALATTGLQSLSAVEIHEMKVPPRSNILARVRAASSAVTLEQLPHLRSVTVRSAAYFVPALRDVLRRVRPSVVHAHFAQNGLLAAAATQGVTPIIVNFHGYDVLDVTAREGWGALRSFLDGCDGIVHSGFLRRHVAAHLDLRLHEVTLGVNQGIFQRVPRASRWPSPLRLLTVGRLVPQKGHWFAIQSVALLARNRGELDPCLTIVGDGPDRSKLESLVRELDMGPRVRFAGALGEAGVATEMANNDVLLVPSIPFEGWEESFCRVAIEGLSSGLAVIGTRTGGLGETIGEGGWLVSPGDSKGLASAIESLVDHGSPDSVAEGAYKRAEAFAIERMWREYHDVTSIVANGS